MSNIKLEGIVKFIKFENKDNNYKIISFKASYIPKGFTSSNITLKGVMPLVYVGQKIRVTAKECFHSTYGKQLEVITFEEVNENTEEGIIRQLIHINKIGESIAKKLYDTFGNEVFEVIEYHPELLAKIKGISKEKATIISEDYRNNKSYLEVIKCLKKYELSDSACVLLYEKYGRGIINKVDKNPYILVEELNSAKFTAIDRIALDSGIKKNDYRRVKSGIKYVLSQELLNGNTCVEYNKLSKYCISELEIEEDDFINSIIELQVAKRINIEKRKDKSKWVYLPELFRAEKTVARRLLNIRNQENKNYIKNFSKKLNIAANNIKIDLSEEQKDVLYKLNDNNIVVVTGGPGTGKTTIIKTILDIYLLENKTFTLCAPTGRAAKRITETTGIEAKTLHRTLEIRRIDEESNELRGEIKPIKSDLIIVDEMSMVDIYLMDCLLRAVQDGTKLMLVGDMEQLPSVGPGSILKDIINSNEFDVIRLNKIFRQAAKSKIIVNAHNVNEGKPIAQNFKNESDYDKDFYFIKCENDEEILHELLMLCKSKLKTKYGFEYNENVQVLSPTKQTILGTKELNKSIQNAVNKSKTGKKYGDFIYKENDRVMQITNNYDLEWFKKTEVGKGVFNGELGYITNIDVKNEKLTIRFDDGKYVNYKFNELDQIEPAYCITVHKSQGSEFDVIIMPIIHANSFLLYRNLLYTGMTRAKKLLIFIGYEEVAQQMIDNNITKKRNCGLLYKLTKK